MVTSFQGLYLMPLISIPVMLSFPAALQVGVVVSRVLYCTVLYCTVLYYTAQVYWCTNNFISLVQSRVVKHPVIKKKLGIGEMIQWKPSDLPMTNFHVSLMTTPESTL